MKLSKQLTFGLISLVTLVSTGAIMTPVQAHDLEGRQMRKEMRFEQKLAGNQYYNMYAPYLEPAYAPSPGIVNEVMRVF